MVDLMQGGNSAFGGNEKGPRNGRSLIRGRKMRGPGKPLLLTT